VLLKKRAWETTKTQNSDWLNVLKVMQPVRREVHAVLSEKRFQIYPVLLQNTPSQDNRGQVLFVYSSQHLLLFEENTFYH